MIGSRNHCLRIEREGAEVAGMMSLEMLGFTGDDQVVVPGVVTERTRGDFLAVVANHESAHLLEMFDADDAEDDRARAFLELVVAAEDSQAGMAASLSDHGPFWDAGHAALIVTDTAFLRNPHYHRATDTRFSRLRLPRPLHRGRDRRSPRVPERPRDLNLVDFFHELLIIGSALRSPSPRG